MEVLKLDRERKIHLCHETLFEADRWLSANDGKGRGLLEITLSLFKASAAKRNLNFYDLYVAAWAFMLEDDRSLTVEQTIKIMEKHISEVGVANVMVAIANAQTEFHPQLKKPKETEEKKTVIMPSSKLPKKA